MKLNILDRINFKKFIQCILSNKTIQVNLKNKFGFKPKFEYCFFETKLNVKYWKKKFDLIHFFFFEQKDIINQHF